MRSVALSLLTVTALGVAGCGGSASSLSPGPNAAANRAARRLLTPGLTSVPTPPPSGRKASPDAVRVIRAWSDALRAGHVTTAAGYFAVPSEMVNGAGSGGTVALIHISSLDQAEAANQGLPCGAKLISADQRGRYVNALFRLTGRSGPGGSSSCGGAQGQTARTNFLIADNRIIEWIRAPDDPGDNGNGSGGVAPPGGASPGGGSTGAPVV
ncbi:MAG: hypothetical protein M3022_06430 [Actinomycetota bacterium]|nr:hypothetical protein [Actinomycetota bacterium]